MDNPKNFALGGATDLGVLDSMMNQQEMERRKKNMRGASTAPKMSAAAGDVFSAPAGGVASNFFGV